MVITCRHFLDVMRDLFRKLGRRAEQFKQDMDAGATENTDYECKECRTRFVVKPERCPDCGSKEIVSRQNEEGPV